MAQAKDPYLFDLGENLRAVRMPIGCSVDRQLHFDHFILSRANLQEERVRSVAT